VSRDHRKLEAFQLADRLILELYRITRTLPDSERYGLQSQLRRAAVSIATNIVEGCSRPTTPDYCRFLSIAHGSAREVAYLLTLSTRLGYLVESATAPLADGYDHTAAMLQRIIDNLS
jgi:four helix bundle protein